MLSIFNFLANTLFHNNEGNNNEVTLSAVTSISAVDSSVDIEEQALQSIINEMDKRATNFGYGVGVGLGKLLDNHKNEDLAEKHLVFGQAAIKQVKKQQKGKKALEES